MSRRSSSLNRIDSGISRHLGNQYAEVLKVANNIDAVVKAASVDLEALALALEEATDFEGISVVSGSVAGWDPVTKVITVPTVKGDTGEDLSLVSIEDDGNGVFTWNFSDGTVFQTPSLTGPRGLQGIQGPQGEKGDFVSLVNVTHQGNGIFKWSFDDGSSYTTPSLTGPQGLKGDKGDKGDKGEDLTIEQIVSNADGTFIWQFSDGTTYTTPNLKGPQGPKGEQGNKGDQGVSVHHLRPTSTTDPEGDYGTFGELDTYTFYGDAHETNVLGWFVMRNGITSNELEPLGIMRRSTYDTNNDGVVDNSEKLEGASLSDVHSFVTDRTGDTSLLTTAAGDLTGAVNELDSEIGDITTLNTTATTVVTAVNELDSEVGNTTTLTTTASNLTDAVNELDSEIGDLGILSTTATTVVGAINELDSEVGNLSTMNVSATTLVDAINVHQSEIGDITSLTTTGSDLVSAINELDSEKYDKAGGTVSGNMTVTGSVTVSGNLTINGTTTTVNTEEILVTDTTLVLNAGEVGNGVTAGSAGIQVDRGTLVDYVFEFDEVTETFRIGEIGNTQAAAAREDMPTNGGVAVWDAGTNKFSTTKALVVDSVNGRDVTADGAKLDGIEVGATADQTAEEIESLYESLPDTNKFTNADKSFLSSNVSLDTVATTLPGGVNELHGEIDAVVAGTTDIAFDNTVSGLSALTVKAAIDEVKAGVDNNSANIGNMALDTAATDLTAAVNEVLTQSSNHINDTQDAHQASAVSYDNSTSGVTAVDVQSALDEIEARVDLADQHRSSTGEDHTFIDQDVTTTGTPKFNSVQFNGGTGTQGTVSWNPDEETLDVVMNGAILQVGQEFVVNVRNASGTLIPNGTPVMFVGTLGASGRVLVLPMDNIDRTNLMRFIGLATTDIPANDDGKVTQFGKIREIDTSGGLYGEVWVDGDVIYLNPDVPNGLTKVEPTKDKMDVPVAVVVDTHSSNGTLFVRALPSDRNINNKALNILVNLIPGVQGNDLQEVLQDMRTTTVVNYNELQSNAIAMAIALG